jgi:hypothetical protein
MGLGDIEHKPAGLLIFSESPDPAELDEPGPALERP